MFFSKYEEDIKNLEDKLRNHIINMNTYKDVKEIKLVIFKVDYLMDVIKPRLFLQEKRFICNEIKEFLYHIKSISYDLKSLKTQPSDIHDTIISRVYDTIHELSRKNKILLSDISDNIVCENKYNIDSNDNLKTLFKILDVLKEIFNDIINNKNVTEKLEDIINNIDVHITYLQEELYDLNNSINRID